MAFLIGTDEAGYGPNLGPLVISGTVWRVPDELRLTDLYEILKSAIAREPSRSDTAQIAIADSKLLYSSGGSLENLEAGIWSAAALLQNRPTTWREVWSRFDSTCTKSMARADWFRDYDEPLPIDLDPVRQTACEQRLASALQTASIQLCQLRSRVVFPDQFNDLVDHYDNKGAALSAVTLELIRELAETLGDEPILIHCDKHGGRNRYGALLQHYFPEHLIEVRGEGRAESIYRWGPPARRIEIRFVAKGETFMPSALASMISKYLRELAMRAFNQFWCSRIPNLPPTAGYPVDAVRFRNQIAALQQQLSIADRDLWRNR